MLEEEASTSFFFEQGCQGTYFLQPEQDLASPVRPRRQGCHCPRVWQPLPTPCLLQQLELSGSEALATLFLFLPVRRG